MTLELQATPEEVMRGVEALQAYGEEREIDMKTLFGLTLALEECASNIVNHALQRDASRSFQVSFNDADGGMVIELRDSGPEFDPTATPDREPSPEDDDEPPGGWGIQLVRRYIDEILYSRSFGENVLRLIKNSVSS
ncbi:ATP-binding protein [Haloferula sp.]|uniref:ATP-binding protein n=1 Tax=Haloferula sp. TaxID=2497595 RepID=UPI003C75A47C